MTSAALPRPLGKYQLQARLGHGGMAEVYRAHHPTLNRPVAIKVLHPHLAETDDFLRRFQHEAQAVAKLQHPHIVQVFDFDVAGEQHFMVMEFVDGPSLKDRLDTLYLRGERLPLAEVLGIFRALLDAVGYAHAHGMIHRDLKPANVMLDGATGRPVLTDFGIARLLDAQKVTVAGAVIGTPAYISPEQSHGEPGDARSDLYALGIMLYECLTGQVPFEGDTSVSVLLKHVTTPVPAVRALRPDLPAQAETILFKALAKHPNDRYQTAAEFWAALQTLTLDSDTRLPSQPPATRISAEATTQPAARLSPARYLTQRITQLPRRVQVGSALASLAVLATVVALLVPRLLTSAPIAEPLALGQSELAAAHYQLAADAFTTALNLESDNVEALLGRAAAYEALGQIEDAFADLEQATAHTPPVAAAYREHARIAAQYGLADAASILAHLDRAIELAGDSGAEAARAAYTRGWVILNFPIVDERPNPQAALEDLNRAAKLDPQLADAPLMLARAHLLLKQFAEALTFANRAVDLNPEAALPHHVRAVIYFALDDFNAARDDLTAALEREATPQQRATWLTERAYLAARLNQTAEALTDVNAALELESTSLLALHLRAHLDPTQPARTPAEVEALQTQTPTDDLLWQAIVETQ